MLRPAEAHAELIVDADAVLPALERFQPVFAAPEQTPRLKPSA